MKQFKNPKRTRQIAILLAVITGIAFLGSALITCLTFQTGLYSKNFQKALSESYSQIQYYYSVKIFNNHVNQTPLPKITNMEYGIMSGYSQNFNPENINDFIYSNFSKTKPLQTSAQYIFEQNTHIQYNTVSNTLIPILLGHISNTLHDDSAEHQEAINQIVYNRDDGLFYFVTTNASLPITKFGVNKDNVTEKLFIKADSLSETEYFQIDDSTKNSLMADSDYVSDRQDSTDNTNTVKTEEKNSHFPYKSKSGTCNPIDTSKYQTWGRIYVNNFHFETSRITIVTTADLGDIVYDPNMYLFDETDEELLDVSDEERLEAENTNLPYIAYQNETDHASYLCIVSNVNSSISTEGNDLFAEAYQLLSFLYRFRYLFLITTFLSAAVVIALLITINQAIRCEKENGTVLLSFRHKIPLLVYLGIMGTCIFAGIVFLFFLMEYMFLKGSLNTTTGLIFLSGAYIVTISLLLLLYTNLLTRFHHKILWKYTISRVLCATFKKYRKIITENTSLFAKGSIIYLITAFAQLVCLLLVSSYQTKKMTLTIWLLFILISIPVYFYILLQLKQLQNAAMRLANGNFHEKADTQKMLWEFKKHGEYLNKVHDGITIALNEQMKSERFRTELITNVSHDIKTPLTSIINYLDLLQKSNISEEEKREYLKILNHQSARLKKLIEDLIEASKASTGNLPVNLEKCDLDILLTQTVGEFEEKLLTNNLQLIIKSVEKPVCISADSRHLWRIFDNLMNNICKYAQPGTRVYINQEVTPEYIKIIFLNTSKYSLNISGEELMERFVRGDSSRNTEGSGLGLSIARSLAELMNATLNIIIEGDLFKIVLTFPVEY